MAVGIVSAGGVFRRRDVLNDATAGHILIGDDLEDGWLRWENDMNKDLRGQGAPKAYGVLMGWGEEKRETPGVK